VQVGCLLPPVRDRCIARWPLYICACVAEAVTQGWKDDEGQPGLMFPLSELLFVMGTRKPGAQLEVEWPSPERTAAAC